MSKEDEETFLQYLRSLGHLVILPATSPSSDFAPIQVLPEPSQDEDTRKFWLLNKAVHLPVATEYAPEKNCYVIDGFQSPVVEFHRSWTVSQMMLAGAIRADMNYLDSKKQALAPNPAELRNCLNRSRTGFVRTSSF